MADISISGAVTNINNGKPLHMIKVSAYRDLDLVGKEYTDEAGRYGLTVPAGAPVTLSKSSAFAALEQHSLRSLRPRCRPPCPFGPFVRRGTLLRGKSGSQRACDARSSRTPHARHLSS